MAIPSGSGTEVLKRVSVHNNSDAYATVITGVAIHIYTVLSVVACDLGNAVEELSMRVDISAAGSNQIFLLNSQPLPAKGTFTFSDKIVLTGTDKLEIWNSAGNVDWYVTYIDQDWS